MDLNNIEFRKPYYQKPSGKETKKAPTDWATNNKIQIRKGKQRIDSLTEKVIYVGGKKIKVLKATKDQPWGKAKPRQKAKAYFSKIKKINDSI